MTEVNSRRVNVHSKLTVVSSTPIGPDKTHGFTALDHAMGLHTVHVIFYYRSNPFHEGRFESDLDNLRVSLSELLCKYPVITGRLARRVDDGNWEVRCNDAGVRMLMASVGSTLDEWLRCADASDERDLTVWEDMPDDPSIWSPFRIQLNAFEGGGLAIGLSFTHMHADPTSAALFFKSWTEVARGEPVGYPPIFHLPALHGRPSPNTNKKATYATNPVSETPYVKMVTATFRFSNSMIKHCLSEVIDKCPDATPFDFLAAMFWTRIIRLNAPKHDCTPPLSICVDFRKHLQVPIPCGYFGNALHFSLLSLGDEALDHGGLGLVVGIVHRHVASLEKENFMSTVDWLESCKGVNGQSATPLRMYGPELTCVSMEHMIPEGSSGESLMYAAKFKKDEKPVHVSYHLGNVEGEGLILVMPSPEEGLARTVTVTLPEEQIGKLCEDPSILDLKSTMVISGKR